jgi:hypothetical protein
LKLALLDDACNCCQGVAQASVLLHDQTGPVYRALADTTVAAAARTASAALHGEADTPLAGV